MHPLQAQEERAYRSYATQKVHQRLLAENLDFTTRLNEMETQIQNFGIAPPGKIDTVPVVFHILYAPGQNYPGEAQLQAQLDSLNADFFQAVDTPLIYALSKVQELAKLAVVPEIFFCLTKSDPFHFVETTTLSWGMDDLLKSSTYGGVDALDPSQALNIWIAHLSDGNAGYAQMPGGPYATDGIVIDARYFLGGSDTLIGKFYDKGKTLTHLIGSYLGLYELWNEVEPCRDDKVEDTPIHNTPNFFPGDIYYHISLCDTLYRTEMIMNFMDNTDDEVLNMFTQGQKNRMKAVLEEGGLRAGLKSGMAYCESDSLKISEDRTTQSSQIQTLRLRPNPAVNSILIDLASLTPGRVSCTVFNLLGARVWSDNLLLSEKAQSFQLDCSNWSEGEYILTAIFADGTTLAQKFMIASR
jgi:hypothetical protein